MIRALLVGSDKTRFTDLSAAFLENQVMTTWAGSGSEALSRAGDGEFGLIVADEALPDMRGLELAEKVIAKNPMHNLAVISALSPEDFHEASEGLGILMQLSPRPGKDEGCRLLAHLKQILVMTGKATV